MVKVWVTGRADPEKSQQPSTASESMSAPIKIPIIQQRRSKNVSSHERHSTTSLPARTLIPRKRQFSQAFPASKRPTDLDDIYPPSSNSGCTSSNTEPEDSQEKGTTNTMKTEIRCYCHDAENEDMGMCIVCGWSYDEDERNNVVTPALSPSSSLTSISTLAADIVNNYSDPDEDGTTTESVFSPRYRCHCPGTLGKEDPYYCDDCGLESHELEQGRIALTRTRTPSLTSWLGVSEPEVYEKVPNKKGHIVHWDSFTRDTGYQKEWHERGDWRLPKKKDGRWKYAKFQWALEEIPDLGVLDEETVVEAVSILGQKHTDIVREVTDEARRTRELVDPLLHFGKSDTEIEWGPNGDDSEDDREALDLDDVSLSSSKLQPTSEEILYQSTLKALLQCVEAHVDSIVLCTHCRVLYPSAFYTAYPPYAPCPATSNLSVSSCWTTTSVSPRDNLFTRPANFIDLQTAMKAWRSDDWIWVDFKGKMGIWRKDPELSLERDLNPRSVTSTWWGSSAITTEWCVAKSRGRDRLMYRTQHFWFMKQESMGDHLRKYIESEMQDLTIGRWCTNGGVRGLCDHQEKDQKFWEFDDPGKYSGVRRCDKCALEWEVYIGDVMSEEPPLPQTGFKLDFSEKPATEMEKTRKTVTETGPGPDRCLGTRPTTPENKGELVVLTCWRDFGACKSVCDPRWSAHFKEYESINFLGTDSLGNEDGWMDEENEEPAQDWELGGIKKAFETVDVYVDQEGVGDLKSSLDERYGRRLKWLLGLISSWEYEETYTVRFWDLTKIAPKPPMSPIYAKERMLGDGASAQERRAERQRIDGLGSYTWGGDEGI